MTKVVPSDLTSDLLRNFLTKLLSFNGNKEDGSEKPEIEIVNSDKLYVSMKSEITTLQTLVQHLELCIDDQSEIISMLKSKDNTTFSEKVKMTSKKNFTEHPKVNNIDDDASVGKGQKSANTSNSTHDANAISVSTVPLKVNNNKNLGKHGIRKSEIGGVDATDDGFIPVKRKKRKGRIGTADVGSSIDTDAYFEGSADPKTKKVWVFLKKVKDEASPDKIQRYLTTVLNTKLEDVYVKKVDTYYKTVDNNCFLVGVDPEHKQKIYNDDSLWPKGVIYQRFNFVKGQKFLNNQKYGVKHNSSQQQVPKPSSFLEIPNV